MIDLKQLIGKNISQVRKLLKNSDYFIKNYIPSNVIFIYLDNRRFLYTSAGKKYKILNWADLGLTNPKFIWRYNEKQINTKNIRRDSRTHTDICT